MKIHRGKIINWIALFLVFIFAIISINMNDTLESTRIELERFYYAQMDSCEITRLVARKYPSRGNYTVFYSSCSSDYFPIFLANDSVNNEESFEAYQKGAIISKNSNSLIVTISFKEKDYVTKIRHPKTEDDRWSSTKTILIVFSVLTLLIIIVPNSLYERRNK